MNRRRFVQTGQAAVEFAYASIVFIFVVLALVDGARAVWYYNSLSGAARAATRYAIVRGNTDGGRAIGPGSCGSGLTTVVQNRMIALDANSVSVACTWESSSNAVGKKVTVTVTGTFQPITGAFVPGGGNLVMNASSQMVIVY